MATKSDEREDDDEDEDLPTAPLPQALLDAAGIESEEDDDAVEPFKLPLTTATGRKVPRSR